MVQKIATETTGRGAIRLSVAKLSPETLHRSRVDVFSIGNLNIALRNRITKYQRNEVAFFLVLVHQNTRLDVQYVSVIENVAKITHGVNLLKLNKKVFVNKSGQPVEVNCTPKGYS